jgi:hypothetical protein
VESSVNLSTFLLRVHRRPDGGFSFFTDRSIGIHHSVIIGEEKDISDTMGTSMVLRCLFYTDEFTNVLDPAVHARIQPAHVLKS